MTGQNHDGNCMHCETDCKDCKPRHHRGMQKQSYSENVTIPRNVIEKVIQLCPDDDMRAMLGAWL